MSLKSRLRKLELKQVFDAANPPELIVVHAGCDVPDDLGFNSWVIKLHDKDDPYPLLTKSCLPPLMPSE
jgi:hypothetical protein